MKDDKKSIDIEKMFVRGYFNDLYGEALRLQKENEELRAELEAVKTGAGIANPYIIKDNLIKSLRESLKLAVEAMDWYWEHWGTNDAKLKAQGYTLSQITLAKIKAKHGEL
jgi:hypothetical protein